MIKINYLAIIPDQLGAQPDDLDGAPYLPAHNLLEPSPISQLSRPTLRDSITLPFAAHGGGLFSQHVTINFERQGVLVIFSIVNHTQSSLVLYYSEGQLCLFNIHISSCRLQQPYLPPAGTTIRSCHGRGIKSPSLFSSRTEMNSYHATYQVDHDTDVDPRSRAPRERQGYQIEKNITRCRMSSLRMSLLKSDPMLRDQGTVDLIIQGEPSECGLFAKSFRSCKLFVQRVRHIAVTSLIRSWQHACKVKQSDLRK